MRHRVVVTGAFSYTGAAVAAQLLARGYEIHTLTNRRPPPASSISSALLRFDSEHLQRELTGARALVNTYWVRMRYGGETFAGAVRNSRVLIEAAVRAGVERIVQVTVSNASAGSKLGYYAGKAQVEEIVRRSGARHSIVRPTLVVGANDVLTNNVAWFLRRFPVFLVPSGPCRVQPITLADNARIIAGEVEGDGDREVDAAGPETFTFAEYASLVARACGVRRLIISAPGWLTFAGLSALGPLLGDTVLTREEILALQQDLLASAAPPLGSESVVAWLQANGPSLGRTYVSDLRRHFGRDRRDALS